MLYPISHETVRERFGERLTLSLPKTPKQREGNALHNLVDEIANERESLKEKRVTAILACVGAVAYIAACAAGVAAAILFWPITCLLFRAFAFGYMTQVGFLIPPAALIGAIALPIMAAQYAYEVFSEQKLQQMEGDFKARIQTFDQKQVAY